MTAFANQPAANDVPAVLRGAVRLRNHCDDLRKALLHEVPGDAAHQLCARVGEIEADALAAMRGARLFEDEAT